MTQRPRMWRRVGSPDEGFAYLRQDGRPLRDQSALARIRQLAIPPAWTDVEIDPRAGAKIQAIGHDAAGRKQYLYHPRFVRAGQRRKFRRLLPLARALPRLRATTDLHLRQSGLGRERVLATVVRLMTRAYFRIGSERYAVRNRTFGIATLRKRHLKVRGNSLFFRYRGKKSVDQRQVVADTPLVEIIAELLELPGDRLFQYRDEAGAVHRVSAAEVNAYLQEITGAKYTSKDLRTWGGTVRAATILADLGPAPSEREARRNLALVCKLVSSELGNTPAVCREAYIHPYVLERYLAGETIALAMRSDPRPVEAESPPGYYAEEAALMRMLEGQDSGFRIRDSGGDT